MNKILIEKGSLWNTFTSSITKILNTLIILTLLTTTTITVFGYSLIQCNYKDNTYCNIVNRTKQICLSKVLQTIKQTLNTTYESTIKTIQNPIPTAKAEQVFNEETGMMVEIDKEQPNMGMFHCGL